MPNIKSAKKREKVICKKTQRNKAYKSALRTAVKAALEEKEGINGKAVKLALKKLDQSVSKGIIHKNTAARNKVKILRNCKAQ